MCCLIYSRDSTTNIKAAGAVDREYANLFFIRCPLCFWAERAVLNQALCKMESAFEFSFGFLVALLDTTMTQCTLSYRYCADTVKSLYKHRTDPCHRYCTDTVQTHRSRCTDTQQKHSKVCVQTYWRHYTDMVQFEHVSTWCLRAPTWLFTSNMASWSFNMAS